MKKLLLFSFILLFFDTTWGQKINEDSLFIASVLTEAKGLFQSDKKAALSKARQGLVLANKIENNFQQCDFNNFIGILNIYNANYDSSLYYLAEAKKLAFKLKNNKLIAKVYTNIGLNYMQQGKYSLSVEASIRAANYLEKIGSIDGIGSIYANISNVYTNLKNTKKALFYADSAIKYFTLSKEESGVANVYNNYGVIYSDLLQNDKALIFYKKSFKIKQDLNDYNGQANCLNNIGTLYIDLKKYDSAKIYFERAGALYKQVNDPKGLSDIAGNLAKVNALTNKVSATEDSKKAHELSKQNIGLDIQSEIAFNVANSYEKKGDYKNSLKYYKIYSTTKDSLSSTEIQNKINDIEIKYESEKKETAITLLNKENKIQKLVINKNETYLIIAVGFLFVIIFITYLLFNRNKIRQTNKLQKEIIKQQDLATKGIIDAEERERKRIAADLHDGVGQLFSTVKMNMEILLDRFLVKDPNANILAEKTLALVDESCAEVRSIAHQIMPNALMKAGLVNAIRDFINKIPTNKLKITVLADGINEHLNSSIETVLYRVIQESVNNVIKHANATQLDITLLSDATEITLAIEDNGKGFDTNDQQKFIGIGLKNMDSRIALLKGSFELSSTMGKGTIIVIHIPLV